MWLVFSEKVGREVDSDFLWILYKKSVNSSMRAKSSSLAQDVWVKYNLDKVISYL